MNWSAALVPLVPPGVVTVTSTVPALPAGAVVVICEELTTVTFVAAFDPNSTAVAPFRFVPVIVTARPPEVGPEDGLTPVTDGGCGPPLPMLYWPEATGVGSRSSGGQRLGCRAGRVGDAAKLHREHRVVADGFVAEERAGCGEVVLVERAVADVGVVGGEDLGAVDVAEDGARWEGDRDRAVRECGQRTRWRRRE